MKCLQCKSEFSPDHHNQKICNDVCRLKRQRKLERRFYHSNRERLLAKVINRQSCAEYKIAKSQYDKERRKLHGEELREYDKNRRDTNFYAGNREKVLERDGYKCQVCDSESSLVVHHIDRSGNRCGSVKERELTNNNLNNLETLCRSCHPKLHSL